MADADTDTLTGISGCSKQGGQHDEDFSPHRFLLPFLLRRLQNSTMLIRYTQPVSRALARSQPRWIAVAQSRQSYSTSPWPAASIPPPLKGVRILDLTRILAGPYCTMLLSDLGADVIKVEDPVGGDGTRSWLPPAAPTLPPDQFPPSLSPEEAERWQTLPPESAYFLSVNRGKRSITLDFKKAEALDIMKKLVAESDVVIENYLPGKLAKFGLGYDQVKKIKSDIIYASLTGYGQTGPAASSPGYDVIIAADAGLMHM